MRRLRAPFGAGPRQAWAAALALLFPISSLVTDSGIGLAGFLFLATAVGWRREAWSAFKAAWPQLRWVVFPFALDLAYGVFLVLSRGQGVSMLDRPLRMFLMMSAIPVVLVARPPARALWLGAAAGALAAFGFVAWQGLWLGVLRPGGLMNPITFGDLAVCLALLAFAGLIDATSARARWFAACGLLAGLAVSLLSGSRGGWLMLALLAALPILLPTRPGVLLPRRLALALPLLAILLAALAYALPQTGVRERVAIGVSDARLYLAGNRAPTSLCVRLELWRAGLMLVAEHPWSGLDTPAYKRRMRTWIAQGKLSPAVFAPPEPPHLHNDVLQVLVTRGIPGLAAWIGTLLAPLGFFWRRLRLRPLALSAAAAAVAGPAAAAAAAQPASKRGATPDARGMHTPWQVPALAGLLLVLAYASFGLTEVIFWSMKASVFYALLVFLLMGWVLDLERAATVSRVAGPAPAHPETVPAACARRPGWRATGWSGRRAGSSRR